MPSPSSTASASTASRRWSTVSGAPRSAPALAESFETALRLSGGIAEVIFPDNEELDADAVLESARLPGLRFSVPSLEPRMFSFNNPGRRLSHL